ncbi:MAG TPA: formate dehydrogenase subunit delta [Rhizomicrobium sp.]|nr:formate dehydrogenase subunit delta [Rhizomicrobium sp.]
MAASTEEKLIQQANQIASFFAAQGEAKAVPAIADHIKKFWDPEMRRKFLTVAAKPETKLHPLVRKAVDLLNVKAG